ncbi:MAG TPA: TM2 domain-containing protein, partial [Acidimicrobiales bacterium]|nr:TM2 domain-containing protein [Acidimicrobiales bacterium]
PTPTPTPAPAALVAPMGYVAPVAGVYLPVVTTPPKSKIAAGLLAFFLGTLGIHRFYLGYNGIGITMLLLTVLSFGILAPIVAIWALVECIVIFAGGMKDSHNRPLG